MKTFFLALMMVYSSAYAAESKWELLVGDTKSDVYINRSLTFSDDWSGYEVIMVDYKKEGFIKKYRLYQSNTICLLGYGQTKWYRHDIPFGEFYRSYNYTKRGATLNDMVTDIICENIISRQKTDKFFQDAWKAEQEKKDIP
jgi:hypothetical protein